MRFRWELLRRATRRTKCSKSCTSGFLRRILPPAMDRRGSITGYGLVPLLQRMRPDRWQRSYSARGTASSSTRSQPMPSHPRPLIPSQTRTAQQNNKPRNTNTTCSVSPLPAGEGARQARTLTRQNGVWYSTGGRATMPLQSLGQPRGRAFDWLVRPSRSGRPWAMRSSRSVRCLQTSGRL